MSDRQLNELLVEAAKDRSATIAGALLQAILITTFGNLIVYWKIMWLNHRIKKLTELTEEMLIESELDIEESVEEMLRRLSDR